jgi:hypothetical protein
MATPLKQKLKNVSNGRKYITSLIEKHTNGEKLNDVEILELVQYHPTKHIRADNIEYLVVRLRMPFNKPALFYKYKGAAVEDDLSYVLCIKNLFGKYDRDKKYEECVMAAFRNESHVGTKKQYFTDNAFIKDGAFHCICANCGTETPNVATDHYPTPYNTIFLDFINQEGLVLSNVEIYENCINEIWLTDEDLATRFRAFHDATATYRLLCRSCNCHFGCYRT